MQPSPRGAPLGDDGQSGLEEIFPAELGATHVWRMRILDNAVNTEARRPAAASGPHPYPQNPQAGHMGVTIVPN
jgi:hypothetical protein